MSDGAGHSQSPPAILLVASQDHLQPFEKGVLDPRPLSEYLDRDPDPALHLPTAMAEQYASALDVVDASNPHACCSCFTAAYGRSPVRSGSYLVTPAGLRRFSPREILRLLGFPDSFHLPTGLTRERAWRCLGNSLSVVAVRRVLGAIPAWGVPSTGTECELAENFRRFLVINIRQLTFGTRQRTMPS